MMARKAGVLGDEFLFERADEPETDEERKWLQHYDYRISKDSAHTGV